MELSGTKPNDSKQNDLNEINEREINDEKIKKPIDDPLVILHDENYDEDERLPPILIQECEECKESQNETLNDEIPINDKTQKRQSLYNVEQQSEDIMDFLARPMEDAVRIVELDEEQGTDEEDVSTDDEQVETMIDLLDPNLMQDVRSQMNPEAHRLNSKMLFDHKIVSPYLLGVFINGELDTSQCALLKNRKSRRQLFYILN